MHFQLIVDIAQIIGSIGTALAAWAAVIVAAFELERWKGESIGKRRIELAEEVLTEFYQLRDLIQRIRYPASYSSEGESRPKGDQESDELKRRRDTYYVPIARYNAEIELVANLMSKRYRMMSLFGTGAEKPFVQIKEVIDNVVVAARVLIYTAGKSDTDQKKKRRSDLVNTR